MSVKGISRREVLKGLGLTAAGAVLSSCAPEVVTEVVTEVVKETVEVPVEVTREGEVIVVTATPPPAPPAKVLHWGRNPGEVDAVWTPIAEIAQQVYPELEVELQAPAEDYAKKLVLSHVAGIGPETAPLGVSDYRGYIGSGMLQTLKPFLDADTEVRAQLENEYPPGAMVGYTWQDNLYAVPTVTEAFVLWYNKDAIDEAGLTPPREIEDNPDQWNWDTVVEYAKALNKGTGFRRERFGMWCLGSGRHPWGFSEAWGHFVHAAGGRLLNPDGDKFTGNTPETAEALQWIADLLLVHDVHPRVGDMITAGLNDRTLFQNGQMGMVVQGEFFRRYLWGSRAPAEGVSINYDLARMPFCPTTGERTNVYHGVGTMLTRAAKDPDAAWKWLKVILTLEAQQVISENWGSRAAHAGTQEAWLATNAGGGPEGLNYSAIPRSDEQGTVPYPSSIFLTIYQFMDPIMLYWYDNILAGTMSVEDGLVQMEADVTEALERGIEEFEARN